MMACNMVANIREEAGMVVGDDGKPVRCYISNSESINNVMRSAKETLLKENPCISQLNKIQFTQNVFEVVHAHQMEELHSAIAGVSDVYILANQVCKPREFFNWKLQVLGLNMELWRSLFTVIM